MRWSHAFIPTLRDDPADAEAVSHKLLVRGGFVRQLMAGSYSMLPLGMRSATKLEQIIREEIESIGGQEFLLPVVHPAEPWKLSGRWDEVEGILVKFVDRRGNDLLLAMTHEEIFSVVAQELASYKELPQIWYHIQTKFRDEPRPKAGLLRVREFIMKDSYSFDIDEAGLDAAFEAHYEAYHRIFGRIGLDTIPVEASNGAMGGTDSVEFMMASAVGEDLVVRCEERDYAANIERAVSVIPAVDDEPWDRAPERFATPGIRTIKALAGGFDFASAERQIKSLVYRVGGELTLVLLRGDHEFQKQKLVDALGQADIEPADAADIRSLLGADPGSLGAVGVSGVTIIADPALTGRTNLVTGANEDDFHLRGVSMERDIAVDQWIDVRAVADGEACPECGGRLALFKTIEVGHIFKLGTTYAKSIGISVLDADGIERPIHMGSYGIGIGRNLAAVVEASHDDKGIVWPIALAPYEVVITVVKVDDPNTMAAAESMYDELRSRGVDVILDDRAERAGVKFNDAELIGFPFRITAGPRGLANGVVEVNDRATGETVEVATGQVVGMLADRIAAAKRPV